VKAALITAAGVILAMASLWVGSYAMWAFDWDDWRKFPSFVTALLAFLGGVGLTMWGSYPSWGMHA
jgi:hypothetical protein